MTDYEDFSLEKPYEIRFLKIEQVNQVTGNKQLDEP